MPATPRVNKTDIYYPHQLHQTSNLNLNLIKCYSTLHAPCKFSLYHVGWDCEADRWWIYVGNSTDAYFDPSSSSHANMCKCDNIRLSVPNSPTERAAPAKYEQTPQILINYIDDRVYLCSAVGEGDHGKGTSPHIVLWYQSRRRP